MHNKIIRKGFTLLEILITLTILTLISLITIGIINPNQQFAKGRNLERMSEMKTIYTALERYNLVNSKYPDEVLNMGYGSNNVREICETGKLEEGEPLGDINCTDKLDLRILVPKFITEIPRDSKGEDSIATVGTGYVIYGTGYIAIKKNDNNVGLYAKVPENGAYLAIGVTEVDLSEPPAQTVPEQITNLNGVVSNGNIDLTWSTPNDGNSPITGYRVEYSKDNFVTQTDIDLGVTNQTQISGITEAGEYKVRVYAINAIGNGGISNLVTANFGVPEQITNLSGIVSNGNIDLTWSTPPNDGNSPITGYRVEYSKDNFVTQTDIDLGVTNQTQISGITVAGEYKVRVYAINALGNGGISNLVTANFGVPSSIEDLVVNESSGNMVLNWTEPNLNGGSLNSYKIRYSDNNFSTYTEISLGNVLNHNFTITNNGVYKFKVLAENQYGIGEDPINLVSGVACNVTCANNNGANVIISTNTTYTTDQINIGTLTVNAGITLTTSKKIDANITNINGTLTSTLGTSIDLTTNDLNIASGGNINVNGKGYQGGWNGNSQNNGYGPGGGQGLASGAGGGHGASGGNGSGGRLGGTQYGSIENPVDMGSGGGGESGRVGGNGGGAVRLVINGNANIIGSITANGGNGALYAGAGAGGSINLDIEGIWSGTGSITVNGGNGGHFSFNGGGAGGRIAIKYGSKTHSGSITANGGSGWQAGGAGTVWQRDSITGDEYLTIDNNNIGNNNNSVTNIDGLLTDTLKNLTITDKANVTLGKALTIGNTMWDMTAQTRFTQNAEITANSLNTINNASESIWTQNAAINYPNVTSLSVGNWQQNAVVTLPAVDNMILLGGTVTLTNGYSFKSGMNLTINNLGILEHKNTPTGNIKENDILLTLGNLTINTGGSININSKGYQGGWNGNSQNNGYGPGGGQGLASGAGGGHGASGGNGSGGRLGGTQYGSIENPVDMGSGGGGESGRVGGNGGGAVRLVINGNANIIGSITANGGNGALYAGAGAGGSINLDIEGIWSGTGSITVNGGNGGHFSFNGGGAGGRIAIKYGSKTHSGSITANGGSGWQSGGAGSIYQLQE